MCLQPAKLTEAFKYFIQGMGYSKFSISDHDSPDCLQIPKKVQESR